MLSFDVSMEKWRSIFLKKKNSKLGSPVDFPGPCSAQNQPVKASQGYWMVYVDERNYGRPTLLALKVGAQNNECLQLSVFDHPVAHYNIIRSRIWNTQKKISKKKFKKTAKKLTCRHCNCSCVHDSVLKPVCEIANMISSYRDIRLLHNIQFFFEIVMKYLNF